CQQLDNSPYNF
nr:immunoglobulin light chain junction region [Macaca mulatta]MOV76494.1 immunoglobulin light chain junction region [Macaca mulatta]